MEDSGGFEDSGILEDSGAWVEGVSELSGAVVIVPLPPQDAAKRMEVESKSTVKIKEIVLFIARPHLKEVFFHLCNLQLSERSLHVLQQMGERRRPNCRG